MTGNCLGWIAYSFVTNNPFIFSANAPGFILSIWLNDGALKLQYQSRCQKSPNQADFYNNEADTTEERPRADDTNNQLIDRREYDEPALTPHEYWVLGIIFYWTGVLAAISFIPSTAEFKQELIGLCVNINMVAFYGAPLSTIATVVRLKQSSSIHRRTLVMTILNTLFWLSYGFGIMDMWILVPNACGLLLALIQLLLCCIFPRPDNSDESSVIGNNDVTGLLIEEDSGELQIV